MKTISELYFSKQLLEVFFLQTPNEILKTLEKLFPLVILIENIYTLYTFTYSMSFFSIYNFSLLLFYLRKDIHFYARKDIKVNLIPTHLSKSQQDRDLPNIIKQSWSMQGGNSMNIFLSVFHYGALPCSVQD